jgi:hypothetical protein
MGQMTFTPLLITTACYLMYRRRVLPRGQRMGLSVAFLGYSFAQFRLPLASDRCRPALTLWTKYKMYDPRLKLTERRQVKCVNGSMAKAFDDKRKRGAQELSKKRPKLVRRKAFAERKARR